MILFQPDEEKKLGQDSQNTYGTLGYSFHRNFDFGVC